MAYDYSGAVAKANSALERFGKTAVLRRLTLGGESFDPVAGGDQFLKIVVLETDGGKQSRDDEGVVRTIKKFMVRVQEGVTPAYGEQIMLTGADAFLLSPKIGDFRNEGIVRTVKTLSPGSTVVFYDMGVEI